MDKNIKDRIILKNMTDIDTLTKVRKSLPLLPEKPLVSVVVANLNYGIFLEETLLSILKQDYGSLEVLIIDGGSKDNSLDIIHQYATDPRVRWVSEADEGNMPAVNKGLKMARGQIVAVLHSSDTYQPGIISEMVKIFKEDPSTVFAGAETRVIDTQGYTANELSSLPMGDQDMTLDEICSFTGYPPIMSSFFRTDLLLQIGGFFNSCHTNTYLLYFVESVLQGYRLRRSSQVLANYRVHSHEAYEKWLDYKFLLYSWQRQWICEKVLKNYVTHLTKKQKRSLKLTGIQDEMFRRIRRLHQTLGALPCFLRYLYYRGSIRWVIAQYLSFGRYAVKKLFNRFLSIKPLDNNPMNIDSRWYLKN